MAETLNEHLASAAAAGKGGLRFVDRRESATWLGWGEVRERAEKVASSLLRLGLRPRERVALIFPTAPEFFDAFFGVLLAGGTPSPLYPPVRLGRLGEYHRRTRRMVELLDAPLVLADARVRRLLGEAVAGLGLRIGCLRLRDLPTAEAGEVPRERAPGAGDLGLVQFSSGTTVDPKPVALSHRALLSQVRLLNSFWPDTAEARHTGVSWLPLYHDMGLIGCVFAALALATDLTLIPPEHFVTRPAIWLRTLSRYGGTVSPAPNFAYGLCLRKISDAELEGVDLGCWKVALNGAEPVSIPVLRAFQERFGPFGLRPEALTPVYGLAEAALAVTFSDLKTPFRTRRFDRRRLAASGIAREDPSGAEWVSVGRPLPETEVEIRHRVAAPGPSGPVGEGVVGRVGVRGPSLMDGYLDLPDETGRVLREGWLDTGDEGFLFREELFLTGRAKDMLLLRGRNVAPQTVEMALDEVAGSRTGCSVAVSWMPEGAESEELLLLVETEKGLGPEELRRLPAACRKAVLAATGLAADHLRLLEPGTLPRTSSGKLRRQEALRLYLAGELQPPDRVTAFGLAAAMGRSAWAFARQRAKGA